MDTNKFSPLTRKLVAMLLAFTMIFTSAVVPGMSLVAWAAEYDSNSKVVTVHNSETISTSQVRTWMGFGTADIFRVLDGSDVKFTSTDNLLGGGASFEPTHGKTYTTQKYTKTGGSFFNPTYEWLDAGKSFTVSVYDILTIVTTKDGVDTIETMNVVRGTSATFKVEPIENYSVEVKHGETVLGTEAKDYSISGLNGDTTVNVVYLSSAQSTVVEGKNDDNAILSYSPTIDANTDNTITVTPAANKYIESVTLKDKDNNIVEWKSAKYEGGVWKGSFKSSASQNEYTIDVECKDVIVASSKDLNFNRLMKAEDIEKEILKLVENGTYITDVEDISVEYYEEVLSLGQQKKEKLELTDDNLIGGLTGIKKTFGTDNVGTDTGVETIIVTYIYDEGTPNVPGTSYEFTVNLVDNRPETTIVAKEGVKHNATDLDAISINKTALTELLFDKVTEKDKADAIEGATVSVGTVKKDGNSVSTITEVGTYTVELKFAETKDHLASTTTATFEVVDARAEAPITISPIGPINVGDKSDVIISAVTGAIVNAQSLTDIKVNLAEGETLPEVGVTKTVKVDVSWGGNNIYKPFKQTVDVEVTGIAIKSELVIESLGNGNTVVTNSEGTAVESGFFFGDRFTLTATPNAKSYVKSIKYYINDVEQEITYEFKDAKTRATSFVFETESKTAIYKVVVEYADRELTLTDGSIDYNFFLKAGEQKYGERSLAEEVFSKLFGTATDNGEAVELKAGDVVVEYNNSDDDTYAPLDFDINDLIGAITSYREFGSKGDKSTETIKITWNGDERYPTVSTTATVTLNESRTASGLVDYEVKDALEAVNLAEEKVDLIEAAIEAYKANSELEKAKLDTVVYDTDNATITTGEDGVVTLVVPMSIEGTSDYYGGEAKIIANIELIPAPTKVILDEEHQDEMGSVKVNDIDLVKGEPVGYRADTAVKVVVTPVAGYAIKSVEIAGVKTDVVFEDGVATVEFKTVDGTDHVIKVTYVEAKFVFNDDIAIDYMYKADGAGAPGTKELKDSLTERIYKAAVAEPAYKNLESVGVQYLARPAGTTVTVHYPKFGIELFGKAYEYGGDTTVTYDEDLWLTPGESINISEFNAKVAQFENRFNELLEAVSSGNAGLGILGDIASFGVDYAKFMGEAKNYHFEAHEFGELAIETIRVQYEDEQYNIPYSEKSVTTIAINDPRIATEIKANNLEIPYGFTPEELREMLNVTLMGEDGVVLDKSILVIEISDEEIVGLNAGDSKTVTVRFEGDDPFALENEGKPVESLYQPSSTTFELVVVKAPCSINIESQVVTYGAELNEVIVKDPAEVETIDFIVGLDLAQMSKDNLMPATYINVQIPSLDKLPIIGDLLKGSTTLGELYDALLGNGLGNLGGLGGEDSPLGDIGIPVDTIEGILNFIESIAGENAAWRDISIVVNEEFDPQVGAYLIASVANDSNYESAFGLGYLVVTPDAHKADIQYYYNDDNGIITQPVIRENENTLTAYATIDGQTNQAATDAIRHLFLRADVEGNVEFIYADSNDELNSMLDRLSQVGLYGQLSFALDWGNDLYYSVPIARAYTVVQGLVDVKFIDEEGNHNRDRVFTYDGNAKDLKVVVTDRNGDVIEDENLKITYIGYTLKNPDEIYRSKEAPRDAGVYTAIATYTNPVSGEYGADIAALAIKPSTVDLTVEDQKVLVGSDYDLGVKVTPEDAEYITVVAGIDARGEIEGDRLDLFDGAINIDFPERMDEVLKKLMPSAYITGISLNDVLTQFDKIEAKMTELNFQPEAINSVKNLLSRIPVTEAGNMKVTFKNNVIPENIGLYVVGAVSCDPNYDLKADMGYLLVQPKGQEAELAFNYVDDNYIFTANYIKSGAIDMGAHVVPNPEAGVSQSECDELADRVHSLFIGVDKNGEFVVTDEPQTAHGAYTQFTYLLDAGNEIFYAEPIMRSYIVVPETVMVNFVDETGAVNHDRVFEYDGEAHAMDVKVTHNEGTVIEDEFLTVRYIGYDADGAVIYDSEEAPTNVGAYTVYAVYANEEADLYGFAAGAMVIKPVQKEIVLTVNDASKTYGLEDPEFTYEVSGDDLFKGHELEDVIRNVEVVREEGEDVGEYNMTISYELDEQLGKKYNVTVVDGTFTIEKAKLLAEVKDYSKVYGDEDPEFTLDIEGLCFEDGVSFDIVRETGEDVGTYAINATVTTENILKNYDVELVPGELTITKAKLEVVGREYSKVYGDEDPAFTVDIEGLRFEDGVGFDFEREAGEDVGTYAINATVTTENILKNYDVELVPGKLTITKAKLEVVGREYSKVYGEEDPAFTVDVEGLRFEDGVGFDFEREAGEDVGTYAINATVTTENILKNYDITVKAGKLQIKPKEVEVTVNDATKAYGEEDPEFTYTANGLVGEDKLVLEYVREEGEAVGTYAILVKDGYKEANPNYVILVTKGVLEITKATNAWDSKLTIENWTYGEEAKKPSADAEFGEVSYKYYADEECTREIEVPTAAGTYYVKATVEGTNNYAGLEAVESFKIAPKEVEVTVNDATKAYGEEDPEFTYTANGLVGEDKLVLEYVREEGEAVGTYAVLVKDGYKEANPNYVILVTKGVLEITQKELSGDAEAIKDQIYTGSSIEPTLVVKDGDKTLVEGTDYIVTYSNNTNVGKATATVTFKGNYTGSFDATFNIIKTIDQHLEDLGLQQKVISVDPQTGASKAYVRGFEYKSKVEDNIKSLKALEGATLVKFMDGKGKEITTGIISTGMEFIIEINGVQHHFIVVIMGDVNGDGMIQATDYRRIQNHIMEVSPKLVDEYALAADIDDNKKVQATDYRAIQNHIMEVKAISQKNKTWEI